ncbi:MAG: NADH-quinone oxidoreductase subunit G, partial [Rhodobacteraceae bacterium]|nr:NADH-quinone oxidoreductase subunit G [Paracoccaceae bacterium]
MSDLRKVIIDGMEIEVDPRMTLLQACEEAGVEVPRFCYHERLSIAGNCRMCLVEVVGGPPKPAASCAMQVKDLRPGPEGAPPEIKTKSPMVKKAREGVMEFLLINHPLDCPICDQGGECDLQDQAMAYGVDMSRFREPKRASEDLDLGPLVSTQMTRCISCTRCVRFTTEVAGITQMGQTGRGEDAEITSYLNQTLNSNLQGNIIDLCPVGALTSKPYAFTARSWELRKTESVDVLDAVGSNIRIDARGPQVMRILPRLNEAVNEEWISDKTRFAYDGLLRQRLDRPYVRRDGQLVPATWDEAFAAIAERMRGLRGEQIAAAAGDLACVESMFALRMLMDAAGSPHRDCRQDGAAIDPSARAGYLFNTTIAGIEDADFCLLIGTDPRWEAPLVNARLRKRWRRGGFTVARVGARTETTYAVEELGNDPAILGAIADGTHPLAQRLRDAKAPMLILGMGAISRSDGAAVLAAARRIAEGCGLVREGWNGFNL